eukprot:461271-Prorocentrum_minimum.AAC.6
MRQGAPRLTSHVYGVGLRTHKVLFNPVLTIGAHETTDVTSSLLLSRRSRAKRPTPVGIEASISANLVAFVSRF